MGQKKDKSGRRYFSLKWQLVTALVPTLVAAAVLVQTAVYFIARESMINSSDQLLEADARAMSAKVNVWSEQVTTQVDLIASMIEGGGLEEPQRVRDYLQNHAPAIDYCDNGIYVVYAGDGTTVEVKDYGTHPEYFEEEWYLFAIANDQAAFDACSYFEEGDEAGYSVSIGRKFRKNGGLGGIVATDAYLAGLTELLQASIQEEAENALLLDSKSGMVIGATQDSYQGGTADTADVFLQALLSDLGTARFATRYNGVDDTMFTAAVPVEGTPWYLVTCLPRAYVLDKLDMILNASVAGVISLVAIIALLTLLVVSRSMKPLTATRDALLEMTSGNFAVSVPKNSKRRRNEITDINENLSGFLDKMRRLLGDIDSATEKLSTHSRKFATMANEMNTDAATQMESVENLTANMEQIAESIQQLAGHATDLDSLAAGTRDHSQEAARKMESTLESTRSTNEHMQTIAGSVYSTGQSMEELSGLVGQMQKSAVEIQTITEVIMDIASQTNLLSLNASIEAARAGNEGRGFAVVAEEIKHLAESSEKNAEQIKNHIDGVTRLIGDTARSVSQNVEEVTVSVKLMEQMEQEMGKVTAAVDETGRLLREVSSNVGQVAEISTSIAAITEEQAAGSQEVVATASQIDELVQNTKRKSDVLRDGTEELHGAAGELNAHMEQFTL